MSRFQLASWSAVGLVLFGFQIGAGHGQISDIVARVSQTSYQEFHLDVENSGLGRYGGPAFNMGFRNRDGWAGAGTLGNQEARLYLQDTLSSLGLGVTTQGSYRNVIAELPGRTTPERIFIVGAHYDHLAGDRPGGDDNASGTAGMLEAARVLSQFRFDSTIRFIGFNAEEDGLLGSKNYVNNVIIPNQQNVVGMINLDMILRPGSDNGNTAIDVDLSTRTSHAPSVAWANKFRQTAATYVPALAVDSRIENEIGGSDQDPFVAAGYPAVFASECTANELFSGSNIYYHTSQDASDRLANNPSSPSGVTYDYPFATKVVQAVVAVLAQEAGYLFELTPCDFNVDGNCNLDDLNLMLQQGPVAPGVTVTPGVNAQFDLTGDGMINSEDVDRWLADSAAQQGLGGPYRPGDANLDGVVDGADFILWNGHKFSSTLHWDRGDFNGDGFADGSDFILWNANKFTSSDGVSYVPEPSTGTMLLALLFRGVVRRRRGADR